MRRLSLLASLLFLLPSLQATDGYPRQKGSYLYFQGTGKADPSIQNRTQRRSLAQQAAILAGKAEIANFIHKLKTRNGETIESAMEKDQNLKLKVKLFLDGVRDVKSAWDAEDSCTAILRIHKRKLLRQLKAKENPLP